MTSVATVSVVDVRIVAGTRRKCDKKTGFFTEMISPRPVQSGTHGICGGPSEEI